MTAGLAAIVAGATFLDVTAVFGAARKPNILRRSRRVSMCEPLEADYAVDEHHLAHLDLHPGNVLVDSKGEPRITDVGISRRLVGPIGSTVMTWAIAGHFPRFAAPEVESKKASRSCVKKLPRRYAISDLDWIGWAPPFENLSPNRELMALIPDFLPVFASDDFMLQIRAAHEGLGAIVLSNVKHRLRRNDGPGELDVDIPSGRCRKTRRPWRDTSSP